MPTSPFFSLCIWAAIFPTWSQVGLSGIVIPALAIRSLRYMRKDDSP